MRARAFPSFLFVMSVAALAGGAMAFAGCSSSDSTTATPTAEAGTTGTDAGTSTGKDSGTTKPAEEDSGTPPTIDECLATCETTHAKGLTKDKAIDTCWAAKCQGPCIDDDGKFDGGMGDAGDVDGGTCSGDIATGSDACDECTKTLCCGEWDGCFDDQDCAALNECRVACFDEE